MVAHSEAFIFGKLRTHYPAKEFALLPQVGDNVGFATRRHLDALALGLWPSRGLFLHGIEIKSDYRDWKRERAEPEKAEALAAYCNYFWVAAANPKVCPVEELPENWGLYVFNDATQVLEVQRRATFREVTTPPSLALVAAILRKAQDAHGPEPELAAARAEGVEAGKAEAARFRDYALADFAELKERVAKFEKASGVDLRYGWQSPEKIGAAVKQVLEGDVMAQKDRLLEAARRVFETFNEEPPTASAKKRR